MADSSTRRFQTYFLNFIGIGLIGALVLVISMKVHRLDKTITTVDRIKEAFAPFINSEERLKNVAFFTHLRTPAVGQLYFQTQFILAPAIISMDSLTADTVIVVENEQSKIKEPELHQIIPTLYINNMDLRLCVRNQEGPENENR